MGLRKKTIETVREQLLERQAVLRKEILAATQELLNDEPFFADAVDQAAADTDRAISVQIKNMERHTLTQIDQTLRRIEDGRFGHCERCDDEISEARLKAFPFTTLCIDCKAEIESEQNRFPGRA